MRKTSGLLLTIISVLTVPRAARAADTWFDLKDFGPVTQRVAVTVENPADVPVEAALVHLPMAEVRKVLPDARFDRVCVVDPAANATTQPKRDRANEYFVPHQVSNRTLIFAIPLEPKQKKKLYVYSAPQPLSMPGFPPKTAWDNRHAYRSFENNLIAYRMETGPGANTMGFGIDAFGKTKAGKGLRLLEAYEHGHDSYHKLAYWGVDILKVGYGPAIGGIYVISGSGSDEKNMGRPQIPTSRVECAYTGPVETLLHCTAPVEVAGKKVTVTRRYTIVGDDRTVRSEDRVEGDDLEGLTIGIGIRDLPSGKWIEKANPGYAISSGDSNQPESGYTSVALSAVFPKSGFERIVELKDPKNAKQGFGDAGHVYVLKPEKVDNALVANNRLTMIWNGDGEISKTEELEKACQRWAAQRDNPVKIELGKEAESKS
ncbi:MAG: hypothetical protein QOF78_311 [Phycisphaerales bacterium]|jgi:hypothetical protein|nr:hypothetical protein [Phycisphaerales bacterium]